MVHEGEFCIRTFLHFGCLPNAHFASVDAALHQIASLGFQLQLASANSSSILRMLLPIWEAPLLTEAKFQFLRICRAAVHSLFLWHADEGAATLQPTPLIPSRFSGQEINENGLNGVHKSAFEPVTSSQNKRRKLKLT